MAVFVPMADYLEILEQELDAVPNRALAEFDARRVLGDVVDWGAVVVQTPRIETDLRQTVRLERWCEGNCEGRWGYRWDFWSTLSAFFESERDAILYALFCDG